MRRDGSIDITHQGIHQHVRYKLYGCIWQVVG